MYIYTGKLLSRNIPGTAIIRITTFHTYINKPRKIYGSGDFVCSF